MRRRARSIFNAPSILLELVRGLARTRRERLILVVCLMASRVWCSEPPAEEVVQIRIAAPVIPIVDEARVRIQAELRSVGFVVDHCDEGEEKRRTCDVAAGAGFIDMAQDGSAVNLAVSSGGEAPLSQRIDLDRHATTAELIAIRAVEMLRAAMLQSLRGGQLEAQSGGAVERFSGFEMVEHPVSPVKSPPPPPEPVEPPIATETASDTWTVQVGPLAEFPGGGITPLLGLQARFRLTTRWFFVGLGIEGSPISGTFSVDEGKIDVRSFGLHSHLGWAAPCGEDWSCHAGLVGGLQQYFFQPRPEAGVESRNARHETLLAAADLTFTRYTSPVWGLYANGKVGALVNAPSVESSGFMGRPYVSVGIGVSMRLTSRN